MLESHKDGMLSKELAHYWTILNNRTVGNSREMFGLLLAASRCMEKLLIDGLCYRIDKKYYVRKIS